MRSRPSGLRYGAPQSVYGNPSSGEFWITPSNDMWLMTLSFRTDVSVPCRRSSVLTAPSPKTHRTPGPGGSVMAGSAADGVDPFDDQLVQVGIAALAQHMQTVVADL